MTDREPVNIMGVIAFPNPDKDKRVIRFIAVLITPSPGSGHIPSRKSQKFLA